MKRGMYGSRRPTPCRNPLMSPSLLLRRERYSAQTSVARIVRSTSLRSTPLAVEQTGAGRRTCSRSRWARDINLQDARHAVTHRRAKLAGSGELLIFDDQRNEVDRLTAEEVAAFMAATHLV